MLFSGRRGRQSPCPLVLLILVVLCSCRAGGRTAGGAPGGSQSAGAGTAATAPAVASQGSKGCGQAAAARGTTVVRRLFSGGVMRTYRLHVPPGYQPTRPLPLVLNFHGHSSNGQQQETYTGFSQLADRDTFLVAYPDGVVASDGLTGWNAYGPHPTPVDDVAFVRDLLHQLEQDWCVDLRRIFATGLSNGGGLTGLLACRLADQIAAFAPVSGAFYPIPGGCHPGRSVPILEIHGTGDPLVPYNGKASLGLPPLPQWLQDWATRDGCRKGPAIFLTHEDITGEEWSDCTAPGVVMHYRIAGGGHTWPGAFSLPYYGKTTRSLDATVVIWQFFSAHPLIGSLPS